MKTFFADYLVQKGLLKEEELVLALLEQCKSTPSVVEIAYEKGLLSPKDIMRIFKVQTLKGVDFVAAAKDLGLWNSDLDLKIQDHYNASKEPLIEILHKKKSISLEAVTAALDEYLVECTSTATSEEQKSPSFVKAEVDHGSSSALPELTVSTQEFTNQFSEEARQSISEACLAVSNEQDAGPSGVERAIGKLRSQSELIHRLWGVSRFAQLPLSERTLENIENILKVVLHSQKPHDLNQLKGISKTINESVDALWVLRSEYLKRGSQEAEAGLGEAEQATLGQVKHKLDEITLLYS